MSSITQWVKTHPRLTAWIVLAIGMNAMVIFEARTVGLLLGQWLALVVATTLVAGLCVWIIGWEDDAEDLEAEAAMKPAGDAPAADEAGAAPAAAKK
jgi:K+ transporter